MKSAASGTVFVDTSIWYARFVASDPYHAAATRLLTRHDRVTLTTDYIIDETLTLLRVRGEQHRALDAGSLFFNGSLGGIYHVTEDDVRTAWDVGLSLERGGLACR